MSKLGYALIKIVHQVVVCITNKKAEVSKLVTNLVMLACDTPELMARKHILK